MDMGRFKVGATVTLDSPYGQFQTASGMVRNGIKGTVQHADKSGVMVLFDGQTQASSVPEHWLGTDAGHVSRDPTT